MNSRSVAVVGTPSTAGRNVSLGRGAKATVSGAARGMAKSPGLGKAGTQQEYALGWSTDAVEEQAETEGGAAVAEAAAQMSAAMLARLERRQERERGRQLMAAAAQQLANGVKMALPSIPSLPVANGPQAQPV